MHAHKVKLAILALILASVFWGATAPIMKLTLEVVPPLTLALLRFIIATAVLLPFVIHKLRVKREDLPLIGLCAIMGISLHIATFFLGLKLTTAINASIIIASIPLFTLFAAHIFLAEKIRFNLFMGCMLGVLGLLIIIGQNLLGGGLSLSPLGDILILISSLCFVCYEIISKKLFKKYDPIVITFYSFAIGSLTFFPSSVIELQSHPHWFNALTFEAAAGILYGIFFSSVGAYVLWQWGLSNIQVSRVGFFLYLDPVIGAALAVLLLGETLTPAFIIGAFLIFGGLFIAEGRLPHPHFIKTEKLDVKPIKQD